MLLIYEKININIILIDIINFYLFPKNGTGIHFSFL